jgi:hypothetical protein
MTVIEILVAPRSTVAIAKVMRTATILLCLAGVASLVVTLRFGIYEYSHGDSRALASVWAALQR